MIASTLSEAVMGNVVLGKQGAQAAVALSNGKDVEGSSAMALGVRSKVLLRLQYYCVP